MLLQAGAETWAGRRGRYTEHEFDEALIQTLRETCLKYIETEHELGLKEIANLIRNAVCLYRPCIDGPRSHCSLEFHTLLHG